MEQPTLQQEITRYLQWAKTNRTEAFRRVQERILREEVQPIMGKLSLSQVNRKLFDLVEGLADSEEKGKLLAVISSAVMVMDWVVPRVEDRPLRIRLDSMRCIVRGFLHSQTQSLQMEQLRGQNLSAARTVERIQKHSAA
jgi:hypothetical protein